MSASLAVQKAIRGRLVASAEVTELVPAGNILDRNARPNPVPSIILGEDQELEGDDTDRRNVRVVSTVHVWRKEVGLAGAKAIAGAIRTALSVDRLAPADGYLFPDCRVTSTRFLRDPDGDHAHGVVTVETLVHEVRS